MVFDLFFYCVTVIYWPPEVSLSPVHLKDWTGFSLESFRCYQQTCHYSWMISSVKDTIEILGWTLHLKISAKDRYKTPPLPNIYRLLFENSLAVSSNEHRNEDTLLTAWFCLATWIKERFYSKHLRGYWHQAIMRGRQFKKSSTEKALGRERASYWA